MEGGDTQWQVPQVQVMPRKHWKPARGCQRATAGCSSQEGACPALQVWAWLSQHYNLSTGKDVQLKIFETWFPKKSGPLN